MITNLKKCDPITLTGEWDTTRNPLMPADDGTRKLVLRFPRWPRLRPLYWLEGWFELPAWCYRTFRTVATLKEYGVSTDEDGLATFECTLQPQETGEWD